jgi:hypothetical protein
MRKYHGLYRAVLSYVSISEETNISLQSLLGNIPFCMTGDFLVIQESKKIDLVCEDMVKELNESINVIYC